jgi:RNA polymerase sigma factor (sigma-70 family)
VTITAMHQRVHQRPNQSIYPSDMECVNTERQRDSALNDYCQSIMGRDLLTVADEQRLATRAQTGDRSARNRLIEGNLRLVVAVAAHYANHGLPLIDLIGAGNEGLVMAVDNFRPDGARLSTYAVPWIRRNCVRALAKHQGLTEDLYFTHSRIKAAQHAALANGRVLNDQDVSKAAHITVDELHLVYQAVAIGRPEKVLSMPAYDGCESIETLADILPDTTQVPVVDQVLQREQISAILPRVLDPREQLVIMCMFGLGDLDGDCKTRQETADLLARVMPPRVSVTTIYNLRKRGLTKLETYMGPLDLEALRPRPRSRLLAS